MDQYLKAAVSHVNVVRKDLGLPPVTRLRRGYRSSADECPLARSIRYGSRKAGLKIQVSCLNDTEIHDQDGRTIKQYPMGKGCQSFRRQFDSGVKVYNFLAIPKPTPDPPECSHRHIEVWPASGTARCSTCGVEGVV